MFLTKIFHTKVWNIGAWSAHKSVEQRRILYCTEAGRNVMSIYMILNG
jgi:hypothetical protein